MYFTEGKQRAFELLMQQKPGFDRYQSGCAGDDEDCGTCRFYRPGWKYEFCDGPFVLGIFRSTSCSFVWRER